MENNTGLFERTIRPATPQDAEELGQVHLSSWRVAYRGLVPDEFLDNMTSRAERVRQALLDGTEETYVIEQEGVIFGFTTFGACRDDDIDRQTTGEIWGIYLAPACFRSGAGRQLCLFAENVLEHRRYTQIKLWVFAGNTNARSFYEAMGYQPDGASRWIERGKPLEIVRYTKDIPQPQPPGTL